MPRSHAVNEATFATIDRRGATGMVVEIQFFKELVHECRFNIRPLRGQNHIDVLTRT